MDFVTKEATRTTQILCTRTPLSRSFSYATVTEFFPEKVYLSGSLRYAEDIAIISAEYRFAVINEREIHIVKPFINHLNSKNILVLIENESDKTNKNYFLKSGEQEQTDTDTSLFGSAPLNSREPNPDTSDETASTKRPRLAGPEAESTDDAILSNKLNYINKCAACHYLFTRSNTRLPIFKTCKGDNVAHFYRTDSSRNSETTNWPHIEVIEGCDSEARTYTVKKVTESPIETSQYRLILLRNNDAIGGGTFVACQKAMVIKKKTLPLKTVDPVELNNLLLEAVSKNHATSPSTLRENKNLVLEPLDPYTEKLTEQFNIKTACLSILIKQYQNRAKEFFSHRDTVGKPKEEIGKALTFIGN
ncbi:hypothetical protein [Endozoicomonas sp.]|uniref:hypothetical protein n=1 Tax=Endozoicomonas sp. TaxID=1892382 RepID=UPI002885E1E9|nr:hypothetical protein [Endozoicomonas sp.]